MKKFNITLIAAALSLTFSAGVFAESMSKDEYKASKNRIEAEYKSAKAGCDSLAANAKDICQAEAKGKEEVAEAELKARYEPGAKATYKLSKAKAKADYKVATEKCDDLSGDAKSNCTKEAKAAKTRAMDEAKAAYKSDKTGEAAKHERVGEYVDDSVITTKVKAGILNATALKSGEINVETFKGVVQLSGFVNSQSDANKAVEIARGVKGVSSVKNDMQVKGQ
ncbi:MAG: BON domain-containing protein [Pseudomonadota bacterium]